MRDLILERCPWRYGLRLLLVTAIATSSMVSPLRGQEPVDVRRAQATRAELQSALAELDKVVQSPAYSGALRKAKQAEADLVRQRLSEGDFQTGDQLQIAVVGEPTLSGQFPVLQDRTLAFPQLPAISLRGVLRSEAGEYLGTQIRQYVRNAQVFVQASYIRIAIIGAVTRPGYFSLPADNLVSDAIMAAGGPISGTDLGKSVIRRSGKLVVTEDQVRVSLAQGQSLDQLNLHGGDELIVGGSTKPRQGGGVLSWLLPLQGLLGLVVVLTQVL